ncbi:MAG: biotin-dependent carboxyltransferase family protein [Acetobacteraceae bacterium]|nr:biotin-dependent carboxyltransferase family protein [Acetobacteraceae bacterium]
MTQPALHAVAPSPFATVQDAGRIGWRRYGVTGAGAMDLESYAVANALVGNPLEAAVVEFAHGGGEWALSGPPVRVAVAGGSFGASIDNRPVPPNTSAVLREGQSLRIGGAKDAVWGYLAVSGGIQVAPELGSRSTHARGGMGGVDGRPLAAGDSLPLGGTARDGGERMLHRPVLDRHAPVRVVLGPQDDYFTRESVAVFLSSHYEITWQADRMGYRLEGPPLEHQRGFNIVSDAILPGCIQVPGSGRPIVLLRDAQTTGGYPKVATIVSADLGRFAQLRPLSKVRFKAVSPEDAQLLRREFICRVQATALHVQPA